MSNQYNNNNNDEYRDSDYYSTNDGYSEDETLLDNGYDPHDLYAHDEPEQDGAVDYRDFHWDVLPPEHKDGDWVSRDMYENMYNEFAITSAADAVLGKRHDELINKFNVQGNQLNQAIEARRRAEENEQLAANRNYSERAGLDKREQEIQSQENKFRWTKYGLWTGVGVLALISILLSIWLFNVKDDNKSVSGNSEAQKETISQLNKDLESERAAKQAAEGNNGELQKQVEELTGKTGDLSKERDDLKSQIEERDKQLKELSERIDSIEDVEPTTVTKTVPAEAQTVTEQANAETITQTVTETAPANQE